ncbi:MAG TPA: hypothetical protein VNK04_00995 [Gemmataceae bacterium]|nr:hypothetical protein [Gemmataceae bacterium]
MVTAAIQHLLATVRDTSSSAADMRAAAQSLLSAVAQATVAEANAALAQLAEHILLDDLSRAAFLALVCGALVEQGCDPSVLNQPLNQRLRALLEASARLADACIARIPELEGEDNPAETFAKARQQVADAMPLEDAAWQALDLFWRPAIAVFSVSRAARAEARGLRDLAAKIANYHEGGHWLQLMLSVLDDEPLLAIEPHTRLGMLARMSGIVDNFQLHVLLMDTFPHAGILPRRRVPKRVADVARGLGPQQTDDTVTGNWNLYTWKAIEPDLRLPDPSDYGASVYWIWNEGSPEDIPVFEGYRVVLLGPASYSRSWGCQRMFDKLPASLDVERRLAKSEVTDWLQRMAAAKGVS